MSRWVRLWEDMPNDPKWRVVARRAALQCVTSVSIGDVVSVFVCMLVNADSHGNLVNWCDEDIAAALEYETEKITAIREAMEGKVLASNYLKGWEKRQPKREDSSTERVRAFRAKRDAVKHDVTQCNAPEEKRIETDKIESSLRSDSKPSKKKNDLQKLSALEILKTALSEKTARDVIDHRKAKRSPLTPRAAEGLVAAFRDHGDCEEAAAAMIVNGWQGFRSEWLCNAPPRAGPQGRSNGNEGFVKSVLQEIESDKRRREEGSAEVVPMLQLERK